LFLKKIHRTIITFALATLTPAITWIVFIPLVFLIAILQNPKLLGIGVSLPALIVRFIIAVVLIYFWTVFFFSLMHTLFLAVPTFIVANYLRIIRWYTVLPASLFIGGAPYILFMAGSPKDTILFVTTMMGLFGFGAGIVFWILWRYWVSPEDYIKKAISIVPCTS